MIRDCDKAKGRKFNKQKRGTEDSWALECLVCVGGEGQEGAVPDDYMLLVLRICGISMSHCPALTHNGL